MCLATMAYVYAAYAVCVTIFSIGKIPTGFKFYGVTCNALTLAIHSYVL